MFLFLKQRLIHTVSHKTRRDCQRNGQEGKVFTVLIVLQGYLIYLLFVINLDVK